MLGFPICNTTTAVIADTSDCIGIALAPVTNTDESIYHGVAFVVIVIIILIVILIVVAVGVVAAGSRRATVAAPIPIIGIVPAAVAIGIDAPAELRALGGEEAIAIDGEHLFVDETAGEFSGFRARVTDPAVWGGAAVEAQGIVLEDEWRRGEAVIDSLVRNETDVFGGHVAKLGFWNHGEKNLVTISIS